MKDMQAQFKKLSRDAADVRSPSLFSGLGAELNLCLFIEHGA